MQRIFLSGAAVNFCLVIAGSVIGLLLKKGIPEKITDTLFKGMALCVLYIGIDGLFEDGMDPIILIASVAIGAVIGELLDLDRLVNKLGAFLETKLGNTQGIAKGFVTSTLLFCIGAMTVVGSIESGISGDNTTLYSKSLIDCVSAAILSTSLGIGVILSAFSVLLIEGGLTLIAFAVAPVLNGEVVSYMTVIGSFLIIALSFNMLEITKIKVMNLLPAIFLPILLCMI